MSSEAAPVSEVSCTATCDTSSHTVSLYKVRCVCQSDSNSLFGRCLQMESVRLLANTADMLFTMPLNPRGLLVFGLVSFSLSTSP